jgi:hypothetical protein
MRPKRRQCSEAYLERYSIIGLKQCDCESTRDPRTAPEASVTFVTGFSSEFLPELIEHTNANDIPGFEFSTVHNALAAGLTAPATPSAQLRANR